MANHDKEMDLETNILILADEFKEKMDNIESVSMCNDS